MLITTDSFGRFTIPIMEGLEECLSDRRHRGLHVQRDRRPGARAPSRRLAARQAGRRHRRHRPAGRQAASRIEAGRARDAGDLRLFADRRSRARSACCPTTRAGRCLATRISSALGRRRIAHITGPERFEAVRLRGEAAIALRSPRPGSGRAGRLLPSRRMVGRLGARGGRRSFSARAAPPDAIFCGNDQIARGAPTRCANAASPVPARCRIVGFDNWEVMAERRRPPLTSVDMNLKELGREAGECLLEMMSGRLSPACGACPAHS